MDGKLFRSFSEASRYAKDQAILTKSISDIKRNGDSWEVISHSAKKQGQKAEITEQKLAVAKEELGELRVELNKLKLEGRAEVKRNKKELEETEEKRKKYLQERFEFFGALSEEELLLLWDKEIIKDLDEKDILRAAIRRKKGISKPLKKPRVCRQCGMVESNCTCGRSWF